MVRNAARERSPVPRALRRMVLALIPPRFRIPLRYHYRRLAGTLDREFDLLETLVGRGERAIDVGANLGVYTYALSRLCRHVEAFEPLPFHASALRALRSDRVRIHQVALSSSSGARNLYFPRVGGEIDHGRGALTPREPSVDLVRVPVRTLDEYGFTDVSFIKVDVEGHELDVLKGAGQTLAASRPTLLVEIEQRHLAFPMSRVFDYLEGLGYRAFFVAEGKLQAIEAALPANVNNFIFLR